MTLRIVALTPPSRVMCPVRQRTPFRNGFEKHDKKPRSQTNWAIMGQVPQEALRGPQSMSWGVRAVPWHERDLFSIMQVVFHLADQCSGVTVHLKYLSNDMKTCCSTSSLNPLIWTFVFNLQCHSFNTAVILSHLMHQPLKLYPHPACTHYAHTHSHLTNSTGSCSAYLYWHKYHCNKVVI